MSEVPGDDRGGIGGVGRDTSATRFARLVSRILRENVPEWTSSGTDSYAGGPATTRGELAHFIGEEDLWPDEVAGRIVAAGDRLGPYLIVRQVGRGGYGVVFEALDERLGRPVALKVPRPDRVQNRALWESFAREARIAGGLGHPGIVRVYDAGAVGGTFYIAGELARGGTLAEYLRRHPGGIPPRVAAVLVRRLADALAHAHGSGVLHRDVKPGNVLLSGPAESGDEGGPPGEPMLSDFGLGTLRVEAAESGGLSGFWQGTPPYLAPEQVIPGLGSIGVRADIYSLGAVLYELLTGRPVFACERIHDLCRVLGRAEPPTPPRQLRRSIPGDLQTICLKCLEHIPTRRYATAAALRSDLDRFLDRRSISARRTSVPGRLLRWACRRPSQAALVAAILLGACLIGTQSLLLLRMARHPGGDPTTSAEGRRVALLDRYAARTLAASEHLAAGRPGTALMGLTGLNDDRGGNEPREFAWRLLRDLASPPVASHPLDRLPAWFPTGAGSGGTGWARGGASLGRELRTGQSAMIAPGVIQFGGAHGYGLFNGELHRFVKCEPPTGVLPRLVYENAGGRTTLDLPAECPLPGPDGSLLVLSHEDRIVGPEGAPPLTWDELSIPAETRGWWSSRIPTRLRVAGVPRAYFRAISGDGEVVALLAHIDPASEESSRCIPVFYDLRSGRGVAYPGRRSEGMIHTRRVGPGGPGGQTAKLIPSFDGRLAAMTGDSPRVEVFETSTGRSLWSLDESRFGPDAICTSLAFSADRRVLVTGDTEGRVRAWDGSDGDLIAEFPRPLARISVVGFHPDYRTIAIVDSEADVIHLWRYESRGDPASTLPHAEGAEVWGVAFLSDRELASCDDRHTLKLWGVDRGTETGSAVVSTTGLMAMAASTGRRAVALVDYRGRVFLGGGREGAVPRLIADLGACGRGVAWAPGGGRLAVGGKSSKVLIWDDCGQSFLQTPHREVYALAWSPDGKTLALGGHDDRGISFWDSTSLRLREHVRAPGRVACLTFTPDGERLFVGDAEGNLLVLDATDPRAEPMTIAEASLIGGLWGLAVSPDGRTLATGGDDALVRLWEPMTMSELARLPGHSVSVRSLAFSPDGRTLATGGHDAKVILWRAGPPD